MQTFNEFVQLKEAATMRATCMRCGKPKTVSTYVWNSGKARCSECGGRLDVAPGQQEGDSEATRLKARIMQMEQDPAVQKGANISSEIHINQHDPAQVYAHYGVDAAEAERLMDQAALLFTLKRKLQKIDPAAHVDFDEG